MKPTGWVYTPDRLAALKIDSNGRFWCYDTRLGDGQLSEMDDAYIMENEKAALVESFHKLNGFNADRKEMRLWVDDLRHPRKGFNLWAKTATEAIKLLKKHKIKEISLDHDLGNDEDGTGYTIACFIEQGAYNGDLERMKWNAHSANPVGVKKMESAMESANKGWERHDNIGRNRSSRS